MQTTYDLKPYDADVLVNQGRALIDYYETVAVRCEDGRLASSWMQQDVMRMLNEREIDIADFSLSAESLGELLIAIRSGELDRSRAGEVFQKMLSDNWSVSEAMADLGIEKVDSAATTDLCRELLAAHPAIVTDVKSGKTKAVGRLIGEAKKRNPNINPGEFRDTCLELISQMNGED